MFLSVFTPTYNRKKTLDRLYNSLCEQTCDDFEWIIVDDGSTDNTQELVNKWIEQRKIRIIYYRQSNMGKPAAHNKGVELSNGNMFVCVDSDDYLRKDTVSMLQKTWGRIIDTGCIGIIAFRVNPEGKSITRIDNNDIVRTTLRKAYKKYHLVGDTMLVYRSDIIKKYSFPIVAGEKFIPESYLYNLLDQEGELYILRDGLYICEYLPDGYTNNVDRLLFNNYKSYILHINSRLKLDDSFKDRLFDSIRYDAIMISHKEKKIVNKAVFPFLSLIGYVPAILIYYKRYRRFRNG